MVVSTLLRRGSLARGGVADSVDGERNRIGRIPLLDSAGVLGSAFWPASIIRRHWNVLVEHGAAAGETTLLLDERFFLLRVARTRGDLIERLSSVRLGASRGPVCFATLGGCPPIPSSWPTLSCLVWLGAGLVFSDL